MLRAVYEGVVLAIRDLAGSLPDMRGDILITGGGARSGIWPQMVADALGRTVAVPAGGELGARGAALIAATAIGWFPDIGTASSATRSIDRRHEPNASRRAEWDAAFDRYRFVRHQLVHPR